MYLPDVVVNRIWTSSRLTCIGEIHGDSNGSVDILVEGSPPTI